MNSQYIYMHRAALPSFSYRHVLLPNSYRHTTLAKIRFYKGERARARWSPAYFEHHSIHWDRERRADAPVAISLTNLMPRLLAAGWQRQAMPLLSSGHVRDDYTVGWAADASRYIGEKKKEAKRTTLYKGTCVRATSTYIYTLVCSGRV